MFRLPCYILLAFGVSITPVTTVQAQGRGYPNQAFPDNETIRCESQDDRPRTCQTPWRGASQLRRQLSDTPCIEGRTWEARGGQIYVSNGCRGEFANLRGNRRGDLRGDRDDYGYGTGSGNTIRCESQDNQPRTCRTPWAGASRLSRQLSGSACIEGRTWQSQRGQISVSGGCRAEFVAGGGNRWSSWPNQGRQDDYLADRLPGGRYSVTCSSSGSRVNSCSWDMRQGKPAVVRQLSGTACTKGRTWGDQGNQVWVRDGCSAVFGAR